MDSIREAAIVAMSEVDWLQVDASLAARREGVDRQVATELGSQIGEMLKPVSYSTVIIALSVALSSMRGDRAVRVEAIAETALAILLMTELAAMVDSDAT